MIEELKLAIKIDDATIEQSLLKQFANAQKMADKVVLDFKNVNFDDKQIEAKFKEMQKKAGQNPIDLTIGGNTLDMLSQIDKRLTEIFSIGKGKSFIDSSSTVADIGKIENKINELDKKYEEAQKKLSSIGSGGISGKDVNLVDNKEFQKLSDNFEKIKGEIDELKQKINTIDIDTEWLNNFTTGLDEELTDTQAKLDNFINDFNSSFEKNNTSTSNTLFNEESIRIFEKLLTSIESSLSSIKGVLVDVGDGEELSPLLKQLDNIREATSNIKLSLNLDLGNEVSERLNQKVSQSTQRQLEAYRKLFSAMKGTGKTNKEMLKFFEPDEASATELIGTYQGIIKRAEEKFKVGNSNAYKKLLGSTYDDLKKEIKNANAQLGRAENKRSENGILGDLFGNNKDLSGVIEHINTIVSKLDEISVSAKGFAETFKNGLNVNASVDEIEKLTNRVKELESELAKIKTSTTVATPQESNISSDISSQVKISDNITDQIVSNEKKKQEAYKATAETVMYHAGILSKLNKAETNGRFYGSNRGTGYFGTGHYFVDSNSKHYLDESSTYSKLPYSSIDISQYDNLFKANNDTIAKSLHEFLKNLTRYTQNDTKFNTNELFSQFENVFGNTVMDIKEFESRINGLKDFMSKSNLSDRSDSVSTQFMKSLGYGGVDTRGTKFADTEYGTVIYDLKEESVLQANITDELQKQGQMLEKINYKKGQVFDSSEDSRLQDIINQQEKGKAIREEYNKIYDDTKLDSYSTELSEINKKLDENDEIIGNCSLGIENAEKEAQQFAKEMKELGIEMSNEEIQNSAIESKKSYQERIDELEKERPLLEARRQELEANLDVESKLSKAAMERATATVEDRMKDAFPDKDVSESVESATNSIKEENNVLEQNTQKVKENTQAKEQNANVNLNKYDKRLDSYNGKIDKYKTTIDRFNDGGWTSSIYLENVQVVKNAVHEYETLLNELKGKDASLVTSDDISKLDNYEKKIKDTIATVTNMSASEKGYNFVSGQKELDKIHKILNENSKMSSEAKAKIRAYYAEIESGNPSMSLDKIHGEILKIYNAEVEAGRAGRTLWDTLKNSGFHQIAAQMAGMVGIYDVINLGKEGFNVVRELNTALTEMRKVSDETVQSLKDYQATTFDTADAVGTTAKQIQNSTADWMRLGESMNQAAESAKDANVLLNVSEFEGIDEATESLVSMSQAYKDLDKMDIIDVLNNIGNNYSISTDGLATALKDSASALVTANNDLNEAVSLTTAGNAITQDPSKVGAGLRTISLRLVGTEAAKKELSDLGEETDGMITTVSKLRDIIMDATKAASSDGKGFDILDSNGNYKSTYEIMQGLADLYDNIVKKDKELGTNNLNLLLETIAGKNRANIAASILQNGDMLRSVYKDAQNSEGSAEKELNSYLDSIDGRQICHVA